MQLRKWKQSQRALQKDKRSVITTICCSCLSFYYQNHKFLSEKLEGKKKQRWCSSFYTPNYRPKNRTCFFFLPSLVLSISFYNYFWQHQLKRRSRRTSFFFFLSIFIQQTKPTVYIGVVSFSIFLIEKTICRNIYK